MSLEAYSNEYAMHIIFDENNNSIFELSIYQITYKKKKIENEVDITEKYAKYLNIPNHQVTAYVSKFALNLQIISQPNDEESFKEPLFLQW